MSFLSNILGNIGITPRLGLGMIRKQLQDAIGYPVEKYELHYYPEHEKISFKVRVKEETRIYPYDESKKLADILRSIMEKELQTNDILDYLIVEYGPDEITAKIYFRDGNGNKQFEIKTI